MECYGFKDNYNWPIEENACPHSSLDAFPKFKMKFPSPTISDMCVLFDLSPGETPTSTFPIKDVWPFPVAPITKTYVLLRFGWNGSWVNTGMKTCPVPALAKIVTVLIWSALEAVFLLCKRCFSLLSEGIMSTIKPEFRKFKKDFFKGLESHQNFASFPKWNGCELPM